MREHPGWQSPLHAIRHRISAAVSAAKYRQPAFAVVDQLQFYPPEVQLDALFITAVSMATTIGLDPHEMVTRARRMIPDVAGFSAHIGAMNDYAKELKK